MGENIFNWAVLLLLDWMSSLRILDITPLPDMWFTNFTPGNFKKLLEILS